MSNFFIHTLSFLTLMFHDQFINLCISKVPIKATNIKQTAYTGPPINVKGKAVVHVLFKLNIYLAEEKTKSEGKQPLVGQGWLIKIKLDWTSFLKKQINGFKVNYVNDVNQLMSKYNLIFLCGVGKILNTLQAAIHLISDEPIFRKPFKVALQIELIS